MMDAERALWKDLRAHRFHGFGFRRRAPLGPYVADFVCHAQRLVIELDGGQHGQPDERARDEVRTRWIESRGYRVVRFWNNDVLTNLDGVLAAIAEIPPSQPSPARGEGFDVAGSDSNATAAKAADVAVTSGSRQ